MPLSATALRALPLFPLPNVVLFPGALLPLHVFEPRYRALTRHCLATHRTLAIPMLRGAPDEMENPAIADIAGAGTILNAVELPDGRFNILVRGEARVRLVELPYVGPFRRARAAVVDDELEVPSAHDLAGLFAIVAAFTAAIRAREPGFDFDVTPATPPAHAMDVIAQHLVVDAETRQALLEEPNPRERVRRTLDAIATQHAALIQGGSAGN